jgi:hypothetical protein
VAPLVAPRLSRRLGGRMRSGSVAADPGAGWGVWEYGGVEWFPRLIIASILLRVGLVVHLVARR